jgi:membrane protein
MEKKSDLQSWGDNAEIKSFILIKRMMNRLLDGFFHFKKRKGEIVAGSATFFSLLSFGPILLTLITLSGFFFPTPDEAKNFVLGAINNNFPNLAPWIFKSISQIVSTQLKGDTGFSFLNFFVLVYASLGVISSLHFGLKTISKEESSGGFLLDDMRSLIAGVSVALFMGGFLMLSSPNILKGWLYTSNASWNDFSDTLIAYNILPALCSLGFFTFYYQWSTPKSISLKESFYGASTFVATFMVGKSFYWVYHLYTKDTLSQSYGNFYTLVVAVLWVYYLMCAFFYGASVACVREREIYQGQLMVGKPVRKKKVEKKKAPASLEEDFDDFEEFDEEDAA